MQLDMGLLRNVHTTNAGAAELFRSLYANQARYDHTAGRWYIWHAPVWSVDSDGGVRRLGIRLPKTLFRMLSEITDTDFSAKIGRWAASLESDAQQEAMLRIASVLKPIAITSSSWDADPDIMGCANGLLDLRTGLLRDGQPQDMITKSTGVTFDASATCPRWERFLDEVFAGNADTISFVRRAVGYSLTGHVNEQCLFLLFGTGCNGKSTFTTTLTSLLGDYAGNTPFNTFQAAQQDSATNDIAGLVGKRLVTSSETSEQRQLNEARIKAMTGEDPVSARLLYREYFQYTPTYHIWLSMNELPRVAGADDGIWRRIRLIPFAVNFLGREDRHLGAALHHELPGILNWALQGLAEWRQSELGMAAQVSEATSAYRSQSDLVRQFMKQYTTTVEGEWTRAAVLYSAFSKWCATQGTKPTSENSFGRRLSAMGYQPARDKRGRGYRGVRLCL
jgi:putative DNA primase/helicase